jgi:hypothetical protein
VKVGPVIVRYLDPIFLAQLIKLYIIGEFVLSRFSEYQSSEFLSSELMFFNSHQQHSTQIVEAPPARHHKIGVRDNIQMKSELPVTSIKCKVGKTRVQKS